MTSQPFMFNADAMPDWPWGRLEPHAYDLVMIDPPWHFTLYSDKGEGKSAQAQYRTMDLAAIKRLRLRELLRPNAVVLLWATSPLLDRAFEVMAAWGVRYATSLVWVKSTKHDKEAFGTGYRARCAHEPILLGIVGEPDTSRRHRSTIRGQIREHSRKPEAAYAWAESYITRPAKGDPIRRADVFSRQSRPGWDSWGNESTKFDQISAGVETEQQLEGAF